MKLNKRLTWLAIPLAVTLTAAVQAIAINGVDGLLPDWLDEGNPAFAWALAAAATAATFGITAYALKRADDSKSAEVRAGLSISTSFGDQSTLSVHETASTVIQWTTSYEIRYSGPEVIVVQDLIPTFPVFETENGPDIQMVRTKRDHIFYAYPSLGAKSAAEAHGDLYDHHDEWPLVLQPGKRVVVSIRQEFAMVFGDRPMSFESDEYFLEVAGVYFQLERLDGDYRVGSWALPTRIVCDHEEWEVDVPYLVMPVGAVLLIPESPPTDLIL